MKTLILSAVLLIVACAPREDAGVKKLEAVAGDEGKVAYCLSKQGLYDEGFYYRCADLGNGRVLVSQFSNPLRISRDRADRRKTVNLKPRKFSEY